MEPQLTVVRNGVVLQIAAAVAADEKFEIRVHSDRNTSVSKISDVSASQPKDYVEKQTSSGDNQREVWFPVVDVDIEPDVEAVAVLSPSVEHEYRWNSHMSSGRDGKTLPGGEIVVPARCVEWWENSLVIDDPNVRLESFFLRIRSRGSHVGRYVRSIHLLSSDWRGHVSLWSAHATSPRQIAVVAVPEGSRPTATTSERQPEKDRGSEDRPLSSARLRQSLHDTVSYVLRSQNNKIDSPARDGVFLFYDLDARSFRCSHWIWTWGPAIKLLLEASSQPVVKTLDTVSQAVKIGEGSLRFQKREGRLTGVASAWWEPTVASSSGYREKCSIADTSLLSGLGWIPLFEATNDSRFLAAAEMLGDAVDRHLKQYEILPQDYLVDSRCWSPTTLDEAVFGLEGVAELYRVSGDERWRSVGRRYIEPIGAKLARSDGLWNRAWRREDGCVLRSRFGTKDAAWVTMGLTAAHRLDETSGYLTDAERIAAQLLRYQEDTGAWATFFDRPSAEVGADEKGTAIWAFLLYRLFQLTSDEQYLAAARKALQWCVEHQYSGSDVNAHGAVVGWSSRSGIMYRRWFTLSCTYTSAFFGLAALAELGLRDAATTV